jgi:hypothetical protein
MSTVNGVNAESEREKGGRSLEKRSSEHANGAPDNLTTQRLLALAAKYEQQLRARETGGVEETRRVVSPSSPRCVEMFQNQYLKKIIVG